MYVYILDIFGVTFLESWRRTPVIIIWSDTPAPPPPAPLPVKHTIVRYQSTKFAPLCRLDYRSHGIEMFSDLWSSLVVLGNISENKITLKSCVILIENVRAETGIVRNGWKCPFAKLTNIAQ